MAKTLDLIRYLVGELSDRGFDVTKTGLVKLLYLSDVEAVRRGRPRVSSIEWVLYKYGPYAFEIEDALRQLAGREIDELAGISALGKAYKVYRATSPEDSVVIDPEEKAVVGSVLDRWGGESLEEILDYVYFETEPMLTAEWLKPLDFGLIRKREPLVSLADLLVQRGEKETAEKLADLKARFWARTHAQAQAAVVPTPAPRFDKVFLDGLRVVDTPEEEV